MQKLNGYQLAEYDVPQQKIGRGSYIADVCPWQNKKLGDYVVRLLWSNRAQACV